MHLRSWSLLPALLLLPACKAPGLPECDAPESVMRDELRLDLAVDLTRPDTPTIRERISVRADRDGRSLTLFGRRHQLLRADGGVRYDGQTATFCTKPYHAGDTVTVELETRPAEADYSDYCGGYDRFALGADGDEPRFAYGPFSEPHCASRWLFVPQSAPEVNERFDDSPSLSRVSLRVEVPSTEWTVLGPTGRGRRSGTTTSFSQRGPFPLYALGFAASPVFDVQPLGTSVGGVGLFAAHAGTTHELTPEVTRLAKTAFDFLERHVGPYAFAGEVVAVTMPKFPGGIEHVGAPWIGVKDKVTPAQLRQLLTHEVVHQWWGNSVRFGDFRDVWLAEAFAEWFTLYRILPSAVDAREAAAALGASRALAGSTVRPLRPSDGAGAAEVKLVFTRAYAYGSSFLEMIAVRLTRDFGRDPLEVFRQWYERMRGKAATTQDFELFLAQTTHDSDTWRALFREWAHSAQPVPKLLLSNYRYADGQLSMSLSLVEGAPELPALRIAAVVDGRLQLLDAPLTRASPSMTLQATMPSAPTSLVIDPDHLYITQVTAAAPQSTPPITY